MRLKIKNRKRVDTGITDKSTLFVNGSEIAAGSYVTEGNNTLYKFNYQTGKAYHIHTEGMFTEARFSIYSLWFDF